MTSLSSKDESGQVWAWQEGNDEVEYSCSKCGCLYMELWAVAIVKSVEGIPLLCLSCDDAQVTGERIMLTPIGMWMAGGV